MGRQLRNCCGPVGAVALLVLLALPSWAAAMADLNSLRSSDERGSLWELPITGERTCVRVISEIGGSVCTDSSYRGYENDDGDDDDGKLEDSYLAKVDDPGGVEIALTEEGKEEQAVVLCNVKCFRADPVCGEDARTYWCGAEDARCAGVEVAYKGYCDFRSGGAEKDGTRAGQSLFLVHLLWLVLAGFLIVADVV